MEQKLLKDVKKGEFFTKKPIEELLVNLPLKNLVESQMNVEVIKNIKDEKEEVNNVSELYK